MPAEQHPDQRYYISVVSLIGSSLSPSVFPRFLPAGGGSRNTSRLREFETVVTEVGDIAAMTSEKSGLERHRRMRPAGTTDREEVEWTRPSPFSASRTWQREEPSLWHTPPVRKSSQFLNMISYGRGRNERCKR